MSNWPYPRIVAHRGGGKLAPENTLAAIDVGAKYGHKMIEFDAKLSKDGEIFLLHDDNLERTSNGWGVAGELNWQDYCAWMRAVGTAKRLKVSRCRCFRRWRNAVVNTG